LLWKGVRCEECIKISPRSQETVSRPATQRQGGEGVGTNSGIKKLRFDSCKNRYQDVQNCRNMGLGWELRKECSVFSFQRCVSRTGRACEGEQRGRIDHWGRRQGIDFAGSPLLTLRVRPCWKPDASARKCFAETDDRPPLLTLRVSKRKTLARPLPRGGEG